MFGSAFQSADQLLFINLEFEQLFAFQKDHRDLVFVFFVQTGIAFYVYFFDFKIVARRNSLQNLMRLFTQMATLL